MKQALNLNPQVYKGVLLKLIDRKYDHYKAKRFTLNNTNQNVWIPNKHLLENGTIREGEDIDYVFRKAKRQMEIAGAELRRDGTYMTIARTIEEWLEVWGNPKHFIDFPDAKGNIVVAVEEKNPIGKVLVCHSLGFVDVDVDGASRYQYYSSYGIRDTYWKAIKGFLE